MMTKYFVIETIAALALLAASPVGAFARVSQATDPPLKGNSDRWVQESGTASYYGPGYHGRLGADGTRFDQQGLTAAHSWLPFGTKVKVTLAHTRRSVIVTITDRMYSSRRVLDLSVAAARHLGIIDRGLAEVTLSPA
jgi:rare lipoprotein A